MKSRTMLGVCGMVTALCLCAGNLIAQDDNGGGPGGGGPGGGFGGGFGGGGPGGGGPGGGFGGRGGFGGGNFDPAQMQQQMQQMMMDNYRQTLNVTNDDEWNVLQPLIQKVMDAQQAVSAGARGGAGMMGMFGGGGPGGGGPGGGGPGGGFGGGRGGAAAQTSDELAALQKAVNDNSPAAQIKDALAKFRAARATKQAALETAQANLKKYVTTKQEAVLVMGGLLQ